ncbi:tetratricopeptide repeat protein [Marixanthomonas spongiae]|uniref:Tetratricopeptide repeat protein n=1 Tax=Marixanthomonas spongiae TaxID=2174845 RepID=A0A2U0I2L3_9FLAO|nr:tetratricopeptide repeat protein [Marixanthomonas spongiae]PVW15352.1 hypothetical protein DDV96_08110 [Marixanthomonas spongiae]
MRIILFILLLFVALTSVHAQNEALAKNYFEQGEYEKARAIYDKLYDKNPNRLDYFIALVEVNQQLEDFTASEKLLQGKLDGRRVYPQLYVELGYNYSLQQKDSLATFNYDKAIDYTLENPNYSYTVAKAFSKYSLLDYAITTYEKAMENDPGKDFNIQLARIYGEQGKLEKMFSRYIDLIEKNPSYKVSAKRNFSDFIKEDPSTEANILLRKILLQRLQNNPDVLYNSLLSWLFIQQKEFKKAFAQEKAIYKRTGEELSGIANLALVTIAEEDYENAKDIVTFIIAHSYTPEAKLQGHQYLMKIALKTATKEDYPEIEQQFEAILNEFGYGPQTYMLQIDYNHFLAFNAEKKDEAIGNLKNLLKDRLTSFQEARVKMELADILVFDEKFNQALIYYSQIQKKVRNDVLAQEARFKVAKTSYYKGDFEWAQIQLDVLRKSASQLIANDAMELSLMIRDNSLEDSTQTALKKYAKADLLALQNKDAQAIALLDDILNNHKGEKIEDEALLKQAELFEKTTQLQKAETNYNKLIAHYPDEILADDAYFKLAKLYEEKLGQSNKAKDLYEQIIYNFADSIYFVEARKRFRALRGDAIE